MHLDPMPLNYISRSVDFARCRCNIDLRGVLVCHLMAQLAAIYGHVRIQPPFCLSEVMDEHSNVIRRSDYKLGYGCFDACFTELHTLEFDTHFCDFTYSLSDDCLKM